jgi:biotin carboxyl carrier protein
VSKKYKLQVHEKIYVIELEEKDDGSISVKIETEKGNKILKTLELEISDTERAIFSVVVDDKTHLVELEQSGLNRSSFSVLIDGKPHMVNAVPILPKGHVSSSHINLMEKFSNSDTSRLTTSNDTVQGITEGAIKAPLVGQVISIKVNPGDSVNQGDVLLIIEAMKMQNEIRTSIKGVVTEVRVTEGEKVKTGDILIIVEKKI